MRTPISKAMRVVHLGLFDDPQRRTGAELLRAWPTMADVAEAASSAGLKVSVVQVCAHPAQLEQGGVTYHFVPRSRVRAGDVPLLQLLSRLQPQVLHVHGLQFASEARALAAQLPGARILLQDHASHPPPWWRRRRWRQGMRAASAISFCAAQQAAPFVRCGVLPPHTPVHALPESTSRFEPGCTAEARRATGVHGAPALLWVGHLDANKDPLTVLEGVRMALADRPLLQLWCCFGTAPLRGAVEQCIARSGLQGRVHLLGHVAHRHIERLMQAADGFVSASHQEGSGYALIEALACGLPPIVTDIPSFRSLTGGGAVGRLWRPGEPHSLRAALRSLPERCRAPARRLVRDHFERELSFDALGRRLAMLYEEILRVPAARDGAAALG